MARDKGDKMEVTGDGLKRVIEELDALILMQKMKKTGPTNQQIADELNHRGLCAESGLVWFAKEVD